MIFGDIFFQLFPTSSLLCSKRLRTKPQQWERGLDPESKWIIGPELCIPLCRIESPGSVVQKF
jgi:hypothetical protein